MFPEAFLGVRSGGLLETPNKVSSILYYKDKCIIGSGRMRL